MTLAGVEVPRAVAASLMGELGGLPAVPRRLLEGAAVAGDPFEPELAGAAADLDAAAILDGLDELLRRDLVRTTDVPRRFRFRHPLVRGAVYAAAPGGWRLGAHERCARHLAALGVPAVERAHHVERSAAHGDLDAVAVLREAGEALLDRTPATAARRFSAALRLLPPGSEGRAALAAAKGRAHFSAGQFGDAHEGMTESLALLPADALAERVGLTAVCAALEHLLGLHEAAHARLERGLAELPPGDTPEAATLMLHLGVDAFYGMDYAAMSTWSERALAVAERLGDPPLVACGASGVALGRAMAGEGPAARGRGRPRTARDRRRSATPSWPAACSSAEPRSPLPSSTSASTRRRPRTPSACSRSPARPARGSSCPCCSGPA